MKEDQHVSKVKSFVPIPGPVVYTSEWYALRRYDPKRTDRPVIFGASEAAAVCNLSPYSSALQVYLEKRGEIDPNFSEQAQRRMDMGKRLETVILDCYEEETDCILAREQLVYFHPDLPFMAASPDAIATFEDGSERSVDAKSTNWRMLDKTGEDTGKFGEPGTDQIPLVYFLQGQQQMAVMGLDRCDFPVLVDGAELRIYSVERNDEIIEQIMRAELELAERILNGDPPEPNWRHEGTARLINSMYGRKAGRVVELTEFEADIWTRKQQLSEQIKKLEAEVDEIKAHILWAMQDADVGRIPGASFEIRRTVVSESYWTEEDVREAERKIGKVKRQGYAKLTSKVTG